MLKVGSVYQAFCNFAFLIFGMLNIFFFARCRLVIGKLKSRGDGEEQQLFCCIVKPWFLGPTFVQEALSELKNVRSDSRCHHSIQSASFEDQLRAIAVGHCSTQFFCGSSNLVE